MQMETYRTLYSIKAEHDYFDGSVCRALQCRLTAEGARLAQRRGMLLKQTADAEWTVLYRNEPDTKNDVLMLELTITDPSFVLYTKWDGFQPSEAYELGLPARKETLDAASAIHKSDRRRNIGSGFCTIALRLTEKMLQAANAGSPLRAVLQFHAPARRWEYLLIQRTDETMPSGNLQMEDATGQVSFQGFKETAAYGRKAWKTVSKSRIPMRLTYGCKLRVTLQDGNKQKRILLSAVPPPQPGQFADVMGDTLRQVCHY